MRRLHDGTERRGGDVDRAPGPEQRLQRRQDAGEQVGARLAAVRDHRLEHGLQDLGPDFGRAGKKEASELHDGGLR